MSFFATCVYLRRNLRAAWPPNASLYASSTCVHLRLLAAPFGQGFTVKCGEKFINISSLPPLQPALLPEPASRARDAQKATQHVFPLSNRELEPNLIEITFVT